MISSIVLVLVIVVGIGAFQALANLPTPPPSAAPPSAFPSQKDRP